MFPVVKKIRIGKTEISVINRERNYAKFMKYIKIVNYTVA